MYDSVATTKVIKRLDILSALSVSQYLGDIQLEETDLKIAVVNADGHKCDRCWNYSTTVGTFSDEPLICDRCKEALTGNF
ncbi:hypothetical protein Dongsha4_05900 [Cyanobacterium sp. Dongsha4]|nr:zinc finger domain-containing protein [Cyanobacterium sp. Dongsha4]WVL01723.1 hypothetical protein Dongsha4_05900 [Cyanobacterium sp. Dongsha4]